MAMFNGYVSHYPRLVETIGAGDVRHESLGNALGSCRLLSGRGSIRRRGGAVRQQRPGRWPEKWRLKGRFFCWKTRITYDWLVVWNMNFTFPYIGNNHPNWLIFFRGVETTNQMKDWEFNMIFYHAKQGGLKENWGLTRKNVMDCGFDRIFYLADKMGPGISGAENWI